MAGLGATRQDAVRLRPVRPTIFTSIPLVKFDLKTSPEARCKPLLPHFVLSAASLYPESELNCYNLYIKFL